MQESNAPRPDVEAIMAELQQYLAADDRTAGGAAADEPAEDDLRGQLALANRTCLTGQPQSLLQRLVWRPFRSWCAETRRFNVAVVRTLNRLVRLLEGDDLPDAAPLLDAQRRRLALLEKISDRLAELERRNPADRLDNLEDRLRKLEGKSAP